MSSSFCCRRYFRLPHSSCFRGISFLVSKRTVNVYDKLFGYIIILKDVTLIQDLENKLRSQQAKAGLNAQYTFQQIITGSDIMIKAIEKAKKIAKTDSSLLIIGETGWTRSKNCLWPSKQSF